VPGIRFAPATLRYAIHYERRVEQEIAGQRPTEMSYRVFISAELRDTADGGAYLLAHTVDSIVPDSGSFVPPNVNLAAARGLRFIGRLAPSGELLDVVPSDTAHARALGQLLGNVREFYPRLPADGLRPGAAWIDTVTATERTGNAEVTVSAVRHATARDWEQRHGHRSVPVEVHGTLTITGSGSQVGQPFEMTGNGTRRALEFVSADGRYLGGESRDSVHLFVTLPAQGMTVPIHQTVRATVSVLP
jgi:hypothetical protein